MSCRPKAFGLNAPTGAVRAWPSSHAWSPHFVLPPFRFLSLECGVRAILELARTIGHRAPETRRLGTCPRRVLPLRLAQEPVRLAGLLRQPLRVADRLLVAHADHRPPAASPAVVRRSGAAAPGHARVPLVGRDLILAGGERLGDRDRVLRTLVVVPVGLSRRRRPRWAFAALRPCRLRTDQRQKMNRPTTCTYLPGLYYMICTICKAFPFHR